MTSTVDKAVREPVILSGPDRVDLSIGTLTLYGLVTEPDPASAGKNAARVASFRNVQYGRIAGRWYEAVPVELSSVVGIWDATQWGPRSPQTVDEPHAATSHLYPRMSIYDRVSEFDCLNLNICTPLATLQATAGTAAKTLLPVIVWIHGGSFEWGDGGGECDGQYLVSHAVQVGRPVVVVGINYRLGTLGFFTSEELRAEARGRGETGYSNLGLHDQRLALQWIQKNIHHFGGDGTRITMAGESAGAISIVAHLRSSEPVARNALVMSAGTVVPVPFAEAQATYDKACETLGVGTDTEATAKDRLAALRKLPYEELYALGADRLESLLSEDPLFFHDWSPPVVGKGGQRFEALERVPAWVDRVVIGNLKEETSHMAQFWSMVPPAKLISFWRSVYDDPAFADEVLALYGVVGPGDDFGEEDKKKLVEAIVACTSDALFGTATYLGATTHLQKNGADAGPDGKALLYRTDQGDVLSSNPAFHGRAYHSLDNAYVFHFPAVAGVDAPAAMRTVSDSFSGAALRLAYGDKLWAPLCRGDDENKLAVFTGETRSSIPETEAIVPPRWLALGDTEERYRLFLQSKDVMWKSGSLASAVS